MTSANVNKKKNETSVEIELSVQSEPAIQPKNNKYKMDPVEREDIIKDIISGYKSGADALSGERKNAINPRGRKSPF